MSGHFRSCLDPTYCSCEQKRYWLVLAIGCLILIGEVAGGMISGSLALLSDAGHVLVDQLAAVVAIWIAWRVRQDKNRAVHLRRRGAHIQGGLLIFIAGFIAWEAWGRIHSSQNILSVAMISVAVLGMIGNYIQHRILAVGEKHFTNIGLDWHVLSDFWQSVAVIVAGILIAITKQPIIDIIISGLIAVVMLYWGIKMLFLARHGSDHGHHH